MHDNLHAEALWLKVDQAITEAKEAARDKRVTIQAAAGPEWVAEASTRPVAQTLLVRSCLESCF